MVDYFLVVVAGKGAKERGCSGERPGGRCSESVDEHDVEGKSVMGFGILTSVHASNSLLICLLIVSL